MKIDKLSIPLFLIVFASVKAAVVDTNILNGPDNVVYYGQYNTVNGQSNQLAGNKNYIRGDYNGVIGDSNVLSGNQNLVAGS
jgi:hypothetical protein